MGKLETMKLGGAKDCISDSLRKEQSTKYDGLGSFEKYGERVEGAVKLQMQNGRVRRGS